MNGVQREAQWNLDPFDMINTQSLFQNSSFSASLPRSSSSSTPSPSSSSTLPSSLSLFSAPDTSSTPCLLPPPFPSRSKSQETLRSSPNAYLTEAQPRPNSTNPFTGNLLPSPRRSLTPDFYTQQQVRSGLNRAMSAVVHSSTIPPSFSRQQSLVPAQAAAPVTQTQKWVTFDDNSDFLSMKAPSAGGTDPPLIPTASSIPFPQPQSSFPSSGFGMDSNWALLHTSTFPTIPPPIPTRTNSNIKNAHIPSRNEFTERWYSGERLCKIQRKDYCVSIISVWFVWKCGFGSVDPFVRNKSFRPTLMGNQEEINICLNSIFSIFPFLNNNGQKKHQLHININIHINVCNILHFKVHDQLYKY